MARKMFMWVYVQINECSRSCQRNFSSPSKAFVYKVRKVNVRRKKQSLLFLFSHFRQFGSLRQRKKQILTVNHRRKELARSERKLSKYFYGLLKWINESPLLRTTFFLCSLSWISIPFLNQWRRSFSYIICHRSFSFNLQATP